MQWLLHCSRKGTNSRFCKNLVRLKLFNDYQLLIYFKIEHTWETIETSDVLQSWPWGIIQGVFYKGSIYDNTPFKKYLENFADGY